MKQYFGGIEGGGTKFYCAVGSGPDDIVAEARFPTTTPEETLQKSIAFFKEQQQKLILEAVGIGSFGPVDLHPGSPTYGSITSTPKPGWANTSFARVIEEALHVPVVFDTDVNAAALGEYTWGAAQGLSDFLYITIGTGIGAGIFANQRLVHGLVHPETGHIALPHDLDRDPFPGICPYHGDCFEGLASGPSMRLRWGQPAETLPLDHPAWALEAHYLALAFSDFIFTLSPQRIVAGGGVMEQIALFPLVRQEVLQLLNGYIHSPAILEDIDHYIVPPGLKNRAGVLGSIALGRSSVSGSHDIISK